MPAPRTPLRYLGCLAVALIAGCGGDPPVVDTAETIRPESAKPAPESAKPASETPSTPGTTPAKEAPKE